LADVKVVRAGIMGVRPALMAGLMAGVEGAAVWALPQRVLLQSVIKGVLFVMTPTKLLCLNPASRHWSASGGDEAVHRWRTGLGLLPTIIATQSSAIAAGAAALSRSQNSSRVAAAAPAALGGDATSAAGAVEGAAGLEERVPKAASVHALGEAARLLGLLVVLGAVNPLVVEVVGELLSLMLAEQVLGEPHGGTPTVAAAAAAAAAKPTPTPGVGGTAAGLMQVSVVMRVEGGVPQAEQRAWSSFVSLSWLAEMDAMSSNGCSFVVGARCLLYIRSLLPD
jgi:hypothetical protein